MMRTPDGHGRLELSRFLAPQVVADHRNAPVNALGYLRVMFAVDDIDDTLDRLVEHGAQLVSSDVVQYEGVYRLCYVRGPEGILIGLAQDLSCACTRRSDLTDRIRDATRRRPLLTAPPGRRRGTARSPTHREPSPGSRQLGPRGGRRRCRSERLLPRPRP